MSRKTLEEADLQDLVRRSQEGDTEAFAGIYNHYFESVYRFTAFRVPEEMAEDIVADVFVKAWEKLHTYKLRRNVPFGAWLFRIARHTVIDAYRTQRAFDEVPEDLPDPDDLNRADDAAKRGDVLRIIREAFSQLPRRYREVLLLTYVSELSHADAAHTLRMTEGGVRILKFRALRKLKEHLPPDFY